MPAMAGNAMAPNSSSWEAVGDAYYRKQDVYQMSWRPGDLLDYIIVGARFGGPIALTLDPSRPVLLGTAPFGRPKLNVHSSSGAPLQSIAWDHPSRLVAFGFTLSDSLVAVSSEGFYRLYPLTPAAGASTSAGYSQHSLGAAVEDVGVLDARIWEDGMVVLKGDHGFVEVRGWPEPEDDGAEEAEEEGGAASALGMPGGSGGAEPGGHPARGGHVEALEGPQGLAEVPACWSVIPPSASSTRAVQVLVGVGDSVVLCDSLEAVDQRLSRGPFSAIVPSPNGRFLALLTGPTSPRPGLVWVVSCDFSRELSEVDLEQAKQGTEAMEGPPRQVVWCGGDTVVVGWDRALLMVGPFGASLRYFYSDPIFLIGELDGIRIVTARACELLSKVGPDALAVFTPGSASPAAILFDAYHNFEKKSAKADEDVRSIRVDLVGAVNTCIRAAGRELEVHWQKQLLKAASFGKAFLDMYDPKDFVNMGKTLRVLNAVRFYEIGIPLTYDQYIAHPPAQLVARLTARSHHLLALRIADFLGVLAAPVLRHWARSTILSAKSSPAEVNSTTALIVNKLQGKKGVSPADVARTAWASGQTALATRLLDHEPRAKKQVPLLISMKQDDLALVKALESSDPDLVYAVLLHLRRSHSLGNFLRFLDKKPDAAALLRVYARQNDVELLRDFYYEDDRRTESACLALEEGGAIADFGDRMAKIRTAAKFFAEDRERSFEQKAVEDQLKLLAAQQGLEKDAEGRKAFSGLSVNETIRQCVMLGMRKQADRLRADFKVPEKRFWYVKMKALIEVRDWDALASWAGKKSPIGFEPFVDQLLATGNHNQAVSYIPKCEARNRVDLYVKCGEWVKAGEECFDRGDRARLMELRQHCPNSMIAASLDKLLDELTTY